MSMGIGINGFGRMGRLGLRVAWDWKEIDFVLYDPGRHRLITAASCTTNCLAPVVKVMHEKVGISPGCMTTIHGITNTQTIVDKGHKDLRRARACGRRRDPGEGAGLVRQRVGLCEPDDEYRQNGCQGVVTMDLKVLATVFAK